ncbi:hypothetical protein [Rubripirellula reticaptiva]|uniref:Uncharacterized protein n=1 Tax=Rubripirellula reticaptiva TaxID=2528013 RepID=A0A5C6FD74_9BACT|nr:hypothetical protein [Rubripirellula reticaptiva]TWU58026.1 hypothetical protein Poly59_09350 [Rubripirellula reticaptiva]
MAFKKLSELLPIDDANSAPHAYQIFGLEDGEQDIARITKSVQATVARLRSVKADSAPAVWKKAAQLVQAARVTLADPAKKAELDARFGIFAIDETPPTAKAPAANSPSKVDPLAGFLPPSNPVAPIAPVAPTTPVTPSIPAVSGIPAGIVVPNTASPIAPSSPAAPVLRNVRPVKTRRRGSKLGTLMMATFILSMLGAIGALSYFLFFGPGTLAITSKDGSLTISTSPGANTGSSTVAQPFPIEDNRAPITKKKFDPVMGNMAGNVEPPFQLSPPDMSTSVQPMIAPEPTEMASKPSLQPEMTTPSKTQPMTEQPAVSDAAVAQADAAIAKVVDVLRSAKWGEMKSLAETTAAMPMNNDQQSLADGLYQLADLATYYQGGIQRGLGSLAVGNDFEVTSDFRVVIVEVGPDFLVVRYNAKNRTFKFDEFPFPLAEKLATFSIAEGPLRQASMSAFQAIAPMSNEGYRDKAIATLGSLDGQVEGADTTLVIEAIKTVTRP